MEKKSWGQMQFFNQSNEKTNKQKMILYNWKLSLYILKICKQETFQEWNARNFFIGTKVAGDKIIQKEVVL